MTKWVKGHAAKSDDFSSVSDPTRWKEEPTVPSCSLTSTHILQQVHQTYMLSNFIFI